MKSVIKDLLILNQFEQVDEYLKNIDVFDQSINDNQLIEILTYTYYFYSELKERKKFYMRVLNKFVNRYHVNECVDMLQHLK